MKTELSASERAYQKVLRSASVREQSSLRMRARLEQAGFSEDVIQEALERAVSAGAINDRRYADALIRSTLLSGKGLRLALREIEELGIDPDTLDAYQDYLEQGEDGELERALAVLRAHPPRSRNVRDGAYRKLVAKGYSSSVAGRAARSYAETLDDVPVD